MNRNIYPPGTKVRMLDGEFEGQVGKTSAYYVAADEYLVKIWHEGKPSGHAHNIRVKAGRLEKLR